MLNLRSQIEYYFSPSNLSRDRYLLSHLSASPTGRSVPLSTLCTFAKVRTICLQSGICGPSGTPSDLQSMENAIVQALEGSERTEVTGPQGARNVGLRQEHAQIIQQMTQQMAVAQQQQQVPRTPPAAGPSDLGADAKAAAANANASSMEPRRSTIILRDIPGTTDPADVRGLFDNIPDLPEIKSVTATIGDNWFVEFEVGEGRDLVDVMLRLREKKWDGRTVKARLKTETQQSNKSFFPASPASRASPASPNSQQQGFNAVSGENSNPNDENSNNNNSNNNNSNSNSNSNNNNNNSNLRGKRILKILGGIWEVTTEMKKTK